MRIFATGNSGAVDSAESEAAKRGSGSSKGHKCVVTLAILMVLALVLRFVFSYSISAGSDYALSGGTNASSHLRIVLEILAGTYDPASQAQFNYPYGIASVSGPVYDYLMAGLAWIVTLFGVSDATAASGVIAWSTPIFAVLTAIPVFAIAKKLTSDDTIALTSVLFFEFCALVISVTPFSYGAEYAFLGLIASVMVYFLVCAIKNADDANLAGIGSIRQKGVIVPALVAGVFLGLVALTWSEYRVLVFAALIMLAVHLVISRVKGRDMGVSVGISTVFLAVGTVIAAVYYVPFGLWDAAFSGACVLAILGIVYSLGFLAVEKKPWIFTIPLFLVVIVAVGAVLAFAVPDLSHDILHGNGLFEAGLVKDLADSFSRSSISSMAMWFGWLTVWLPLFLGIYMLYRYRRDGGKRLYDFAALWFLAMFFLGWFSSTYAIVAAASMAIGAAIVVVTIFRKVDLIGYFRSFKTLRGSGAKGAAKKVFNFFPFVTVVVAVVLILVPNAVYAVDAATPTNDEGPDYFGGLGYTISTDNSSILNTVWSGYKDVHKDGALLTWYSNADTAAQKGGFDNVSSPSASGSSTLSVAMLQDGASGALVSMSVRLLQKDAGLSGAVASAANAANVHQINGDTLKNLVSDATVAGNYLSTEVGSDSTALAEAKAKYAAMNLDDSLRCYYAAYVYLTVECNLTDTELCAVYDAVRDQTGNSISYIEVDTSLLPLYYGDGSYLSTLAYLGGYNLGSYNAATEFYSIYAYSSQGLAMYTDAMYSTFLYKALVGTAPSTYGYTYWHQLWSSLTSADSSVKLTPGVGLTGFAIDTWYVMYRDNADSEWRSMDAYEAMANQVSNPDAQINYMSSVVVYKYVGLNASDVVSGHVTTDDGTAVPNVTVNVYQMKTYGDYTQRVLTSTAVTDVNGYYSVAAPAGSIIVYSTSASATADGNVLETYAVGAGTSAHDLAVGKADVSGFIVDSNNETIPFQGDIEMTLQGSDGVVYKGVITDGAFSFADLVPGTYSVSIYNQSAASGTTSATATFYVIPGETQDLTVTVKSYNLTVTVNDHYSDDTPAGLPVTVRETTTGVTYTADTKVENGKTTAVFSLIPGTYAYYISAEGYVSTSSSTTTISSSTRSVTLEIYEAKEISVNADVSLDGVAVAVVGSTYRTVALDGTAKIPTRFALSSLYSVYATIDGAFYYGTLDVGADSVTLAKAPSTVTVSGKVTLDGTAVNNATVVLDGENYYTTAATDSDGKYSVTVPADTGTYTTYAYNSNSRVDLKTVGSDADSTVDFALGGYSTYGVTFYYYEGSSSTSLPYFGNFTAQFSMGDTAYTLYHVMASSTGKITVIVPSSVNKVTITAGPHDNEYIYFGSYVDPEDSSSAPAAFTKELTSSSSSVYIQRDSSRASEDRPCYLKQVDISGAVFDTSYNGDITYSVGSTTYKLVNGVICDKDGNPVTALSVGRYTLVMTDGIFFNGSFMVRAGVAVQDFALSGEPYAAEKVTITIAEKDKISIVALDDGKYSSYSDDSTSTSKVYYMESGKKFIVTVTDADSKKISVAEITVSSESTVDMTEKKDSVSVSGNLDAPNVKGKMNLVSEGQTVAVVSVSGGSYSVTLAAGSVVEFTSSDLTYESDGKTYTYTIPSGSETYTVPSGVTEAVHNIGVTSAVASEDADISVVDGTVLNEDGTATIVLRLAYTGDREGVTYKIGGSAGLTLDKSYIQYVAAGAAGAVTLTVTGVWDYQKYGAGSDSIAVAVTDIAGTAIDTVTVPAEYYSVAGAAGVTVTIAKVVGDDDSVEVADAVNGYSYRYAVSVKNDCLGYAIVNISAAFASETAGYTVYVADSTGNTVFDASSSSFKVAGKSTSVFYVVVLSADKFQYNSAPSVTYTVYAQSASGSDITVDGDAAGTMSVKTIKTEQESGSVSGNTSSNDKVQIPAAVYILLVIFVILLLFFFWAGYKRGVFSRN